nr:hypothetical protein [Variovorax boronicumulans]
MQPRHVRAWLELRTAEPGGATLGAMPALRHIAVHVEEPRRGQFVWVLTERLGRDWQPLQRAGAAVPRYRLAMAQGLLALQQLMDDLDVGPRAAGTASPVRRGHQHTATAGPPAAPERGRYFGFGPAR